MTTIKDFLVYLSSLGIKLWLEGEAVRYKAPESVMTAELLAQLREHKLQILAFLKENPLWTTTNTFEPIPVLPREGNVFPLSFAQQRLWILDQLEGKSATYNLPSVLCLEGELNDIALERAILTLVERHESLRMCFPTVEGQATMQLLPNYNPLLITDLTALPEADKINQVDKLIETHKLIRFDLTTGHLLHIQLLKLSAKKHFLLVNIHHIISDGWSVSILVREWHQLYAAYSQNHKPELPVQSIQYTDYVVWQRNWLKDNVLERQLTYWKEKLAGYPELLELPTDYPRPKVMRYQGAKLQTTLPVQLTQQLKQYCQHQGVTLYMMLLSAFNILLYRYSGQEDILVGTANANRNHYQTEDLMGFFVNTQVLRVHIQGQQTWLQLLEQVKQTALEAYAHQDIPFEYLVEQLNPTRSLSHSPLFQVMFVLQNTPMADFEQITELNVSLVKSEDTVAKFDLTLSMTEDHHILVCDWEYSTDLFRQETIERLSEHLQILLEAIVNDSSKTSIAQLPLLTEAEQQQLISWNQTTKTDYPSNQTIVDVFQAQVDKTPDNVAVIFENQQLTYFELNAKANQLAHYLMSLGVRAETLVGICVERSLEMVIGLLGILKAGGAYVPLAPDYPASRLQFMLEDSQVSVLLTQSYLVEQLPVFDASVVCVDGEWEKIALYSKENPKRKSGSENLAYIIYTSGSTGKPKGVMIEHLSLLNHMLWMQNTFAFSAQDRVLQKTSFTFDASVCEFYAPLMVGGTLLMAKPQGHQEPTYLVKTIQKYNVTVLFVVPSFLKMLLEIPEFNSIISLRYLICGAEALTNQLREIFYNRNLNIPLYNLYGPTETTIDSTYWRCEKNQPISIGRPISNTQIYILDAYHNLTPPGVPGELCIAGKGLSRGYLNRPELTAEKFIEVELFSKKQRLYKTGDKARWFSDGNLEYLGRLDHQVKLRGFRIELGEIEASLSQHEAVNESVVVLYDLEKNPRLAAYVILSEKLKVKSEKLISTEESSLLFSELRTWLSKSLPEYMIPAHFTELEKLPLMPNGKIDRRALPSPDLTALSKGYEAPRTETERCLVDIWSQVLKQDKIGIFDNFFERGGDSILSIQIVARIRTQGLELSARDIFEHQTIAELAQVVRTSSVTVAEQGLITGVVKLTPIQQAFFAKQPIEPWYFNQAILLNVPKHLDQTALQKALAAILVHHDALRLRYYQVADVWQQKQTTQGDELPFHQEDLSHLSREAQTQTLKERIDFWQASLNLETGPLVRLVFFQLSTEARLLWCIHHLAVDGVSWRILLEDLETTYHQAIANKPLNLPNKTSAFKAWAEHLSQYARSTALTIQAKHWQALPTGNPLPIDNPTGSNQIVDTRHYTISMSKETTQRLLTETPAAYHTQINDILLTALMLSLWTWTGDKKNLIDLESHGRAELFNELDLSRTVGWFTSLYTWSLTLPTETTDLGACLKAIKEQLRQVPDDGVGYGVLRYLCQENLPQGQILFNYLGQFDQIVSQSDWTLAPEEAGRSQSLQGKREYLIEINGQTVNGCLSLTWSYSGEQYQAQTIEKLANDYQQQLQLLIEHCTTHYGYTPSDFPLTVLSQSQLDPLANTYGKNIADIYPLSPMQQGMLFHTLYAPESGIYFEQFHCGFTGDLNEEAFRQAWEFLVERHTILRTAFWIEGEKPLQLVCRQTSLPWQSLDWSDLSTEQRQLQLETLLREERQQGFELNQAPLMHLQLIREAEKQYRFVWNHHHLLMDGWCLPILFTELLEIYQAYQQGQLPHLPPVSSYRSYINWLVQQDFAKAQSYWQEQLKGFSTPTPLPIGQSSVQPASYQIVDLTLDASLSHSLETFSQQHHLTLNTLIQGAWAILLGRYSGESDIIFGVTTSGRQVPVAGIEQMVGLFINTLPLRVNLSGETLVAVLQTILQQQQQNDQYAYSSLVDIQNWSEVPNGVSLFDSLMVFENYPVDEKLKSDNWTEAASLSLTDVQGIEYTNYPITLAVIPKEALHFKLTYDSNRFSQVSMEQMLLHLSQLLEGIIAESTCAWYQLPLLTKKEQQQLIAWNQTETDYPSNQTIVDLFQTQVEKMPDNIAVVFENQQLTYFELNAKANQLAHYLMSLGVRAETLVGICVERSLEMAIGLLGILKAGGAYVPLDPDYPASRLQFMLKDSQVPVLLTQSNLLEQLAVIDASVIYVDSEWEKISAYSKENPKRQSVPENLAYIIYTSGSTGKPKGCQVTHYNVTRLFAATEAWYHFNHQDVWTLFHSYAFDFSVWELWGALLYGAKLIIVPYLTSRTPEEFYQLLIKQGVTVLNQTPSAFKQLINVDNQPDELSLRLVIFGGEALDFATLQPWFSRHDDKQPQLVNMYGITETTVHVTYYPLTSKLIHNSSFIGCPIPDLQVWVLDSHQKLLPIGVPGEMHISGAGVTRGYLNRPELTAEKFTEVELFGKKQRFYKTGDLARWLPNGHLEYLGRIDEQVKLRGFRIELGEIEATLSQHEAVKETVVVLYDKETNPRLAAYVTLSEKLKVKSEKLRSTEESSLFSELRAWLSKSLPEYMIPAHFMELEKLPLTTNGKIDRKALPAPDLTTLSKGYVAPRTPIEQCLVEVWSHVLKQTDIGVFDNFFERGGDSILSIQIVARVRTQGLELSVRDIFEHQTVAELAQVVRTSSVTVAEQGLITGVVPFTPIQQAFFAKQLAEPWYFNQAILLSVPTQLDQAALKKALAIMLEHHDALRLRYYQVADAWQQKQAGLEDDIPVHWEDLSNEDETVQTQTLKERIDFWQASLNLEKGPLVRLVFFQLSTEARLLWCIHHLAVDGVSWRILLEDLETTYHQAIANKTLKLPNKTSAFKAWAEHLSQWTNSIALTEQAKHWQALPIGNPLPIDNPTGSNQIVDTRHYTISMSTETTQRLLTETPVAYHTQINDILLTALMLTLRAWTGHKTNLIALESHGRAELFHELDLSRTVGWFTSLYTWSLTLPTETDLGACLKAIKEQLRQVPDDGVGYGVLRYLCQENLPQGQILFNYLGQFDQIVSQSDWTLAPEEAGKSQGLQGKREYLIEINGQTVNGCLSLTWSYSGEQYQAQTIEELADNYQQQLQLLIEHCTTHYGYTPSDFPLTILSQSQLDPLANIYGKNIADIYPLSPMQQGMLFHTLYAPESGIYFEQFHCGFTGDLKEDAFRQAWEFLVERYTVLRTAFWIDNEKPLQLVCQQVSLPWQYFDWSDLSTEQRQLQLDTLLKEERQQGFELNQAPLMRCQLIREAEKQYRFVWNHHHLLIDGWCLPILFTELLEVYQAYRQEQLPHLPPVRSYRNYINWLVQQDFAKAQSYWQEQLKGFSTPTSLPIGKSSVQPANYQIVDLTLDASLSHSLETFSQQHHLTLNTLIQGAWAILLGRYSGESDVVFGVTTSGRQVPVAGIEQMVGLFINTLPLRVNLSGETLVTVLQTILQQQQQNDQYAYSSLADIQNWSEVPNGVSLFDTLVVFENYPVDEKLKSESWTEATSLFLTDVKGIEYTNYPITLVIVPKEKALHFTLTYDKNRFSRMEQMLAHLSHLLEGIIAEPDFAWYQLPLLTKAEQQQLIAWNQTETDYPSNQTIVDVFQTQVEKMPDNIAVVFENQQLTYLELNTKANQLAHYLMSLGVRAETLVGICVERSLEMAIGLLGILKAGGAYVPLDPDYPASRLQFMLKDSQVPVLLTQSNLLEQLAVVDASVVYMDSEWEKIALYSKENPKRQSSPDNLAYIIYTSGSTGKPKGCQVTHYNVTRLFAATDTWYHFNHQDVWTLFHSYAFDFSVWELWGALLYGAKLIIVPYLTSRTPEEFYQLLIKQGVTVLNQTPSAFKQLINVDNQPDELSLRLVIFGGEALDFATLQPWFSRHDDKQPQLVNMYGITETTVHVTYYPLTSELIHNSSIIGCPIPDLQVWVFDSHQKLLPIGVPGEMHIGGAGVTRGYLNRPELTAEKFTEVELFGKKQRFYKTGDLARWLPNGHLEYLGRIDEQVKLRGFRIELGEIEATLVQHEAVKESIVVLYDLEKNPRLAAYIVSELNNAVSEPTSLIPELRTWLSDRLPDYMIPAHFTVLEKLPLTPNGKIDRKALPDPEFRIEGKSIIAETETERLLCLLWSQVLDVEVTSLNTHFFEAGGHSLLATQLASRIRDSFQVDMPLKVIFEQATVQEQAQWLEKQQRQTELPNITPLTKDELLELSFAQQRLWFLAQLEGPSATYNMPAALRLEGELNLLALQRTFTYLIERHLNLRLCFPEVKGQAIVQVLPVYNPTEIVDLTELDDIKQQNQVEHLVKTHTIAPFDLTTGPLLRIQLLKLSTKTHLLLVNMHHIISDGWSIGVLVRSFCTLYAAYCQNQEVKLPKLPIQYPDYAAWQRDWLTGEVLEHQLAYWKHKLMGSPELLELPTDYPRPNAMSYQGSHLQTTLSADLTLKLKQLSQQQEVTLYMMLLTAFSILLSRYSGQEDILIGSPIANRTHYQTEEIIGFFVNTLILRTQVQGEQSVNELLKQVRKTALEAYAHQDVPFEYLVEQLNPSRDLSYSPLFQVMLVLQNAPTETLDLTELKLSLVESESTVAKFDLTLSVVEYGEILICDWEYSTDLFSQDSIQGMSEHFQVLLEAIVSDSSESIAQLPLLTEASLQQLIAWNRTEANYPVDKTMVDLFQAQVDKTPDNIAVVFEEQQLSYLELNAKANQLAHYLISLGVGAETLVGICVERSLEMVIGLLGILKAGGAYVPLDPDYPASRLQFMLKDSQVPVLLTQSNLLEQLAVVDASVVYMDSEWEKIALYSKENPKRQSSPDNLAYVIYTSGSTGKPKGVMIEHLPLLNHMLWMQDTFALSAQDRILQKTLFTFDASVCEFYAPLMVGGTLLMAKPSGHREPTYLVKMIRENHVTVLFVVPSLLKMLLELPDFNNQISLRYLTCGAEALTNQLRETVYNSNLNVKFYNLYGPTETTIDSTYWRCEKNQPITIGRPISNTQIYILDAYHNLTLLGVPGELCIAGTGLARGYLNRPDLTAEKFIEIELFGNKQRLYKTGDLARWLPDGNLEYLGRIDHQVKLRGFRIELGEIESTLLQYDSVKEAVVTLYDKKKNPRLVAYLVSHQLSDNSSEGNDKTSEPNSLITDLKTWLKTQLPDYMIPTHITVLEKLPLMPNGKIDRKALPVPDLAVEIESVAPQTETEQLLCLLWSQVLGIKVTNLHINFFEAGGHSLLATQLVSRIRESFQIEMPLKAVFEQATIREQSQWLTQQQCHSELPNITPLSKDEPLVLSFAQQRLWFLAQLEGPSATYNMPAALRLEGELNITALQQAFIHLIERHLNLRLSFPEVEGQAVVQVLPVYNPIEIIDLTELYDAEHQVECLVKAHTIAVFDLAIGPLLRVQLLKLSTKTHLLLFNMHHIISDGWSIGVLIRSFRTLYMAYCHNQQAKLPALPIQYTDYAAWQQNWLVGEVLERQMVYWKDKLANSPELLELPTDYPRPKEMSYQGSHLQTTLPADLTLSLKQLTQQQEITLYMMLLGAFSILLSRYSGQEDILIGSPIANRTHYQTEEIIGFFVNTLILRTQVQGEQSANEILKQVRQTALEAYAHQDIPFEYLVEQLNPSRSLSYSPLFQVMLVLQNAPTETLDLTELKISLVESESTVAKFDLTLSVVEHDEILICNWEYSTDLFREDTIKRLSEHFQVLLEAIVNDSSKSIAHLPLLTETEKQQLIAWNHTEVDYPFDKTIMDLFQAQVNKTPDNIAVVFEEQKLSYLELNAKANQLAHYLMSLGVTAETLVGICVERSLEMVIGLLGILKAGGAYVPLDPDYPASRLQFMLEDSQVSVLLIQSHLIEQLPVSQAQVVCMDDEWKQIAAYSDENPKRQSEPENLAYVIYTSGSTGKPKGVMIEHTAIAQHINDLIVCYQIEPNDKVLQFASLNFDASVEQILSTWCGGAQLILLSTNHLHAKDLQTRLEKEQITIANLPPAYWQQLINEGVNTHLGQLKLLILGGDVLSLQLAQQTREVLSNKITLLNAYGPTEATITATLFEVTEQFQERSDGTTTSIGRPISNTKIYILDVYHNLTPLGVPGELYIAGAGLARGYLNRPELTQEKFIEIELFGKRQRLYKTGDLARWLPDGNLEYLGRIDHQVKLRGFRIELGEIEAMLVQHEVIKESVVILYDKENNPRLATYMTVSSAQVSKEVNEQTLLFTELRTWLSSRLPEYMIPAHFTVLEKLPLMPNGKIDRQALSQLSVNSPQLSSTQFVAPRIPEEKLLVGIWAKVLRIEPKQIGIYDNFFELGGHSLLATQLMSQIRKTFKVELPMRVLFEIPTIAELAVSIEKMRKVTQAAAPALNQDSSTEREEIEF
ncbi:non-ribosomal peptide synthase/polyketide synthase [Candidatus Parabeggiatoa sp. HSG14]|uniref:non-ribosomal peptide synthase/polyketide synthase n=1 Tax=Candidatus Parabeggiatoa sp. HSG14 TaxID=3055593 RepID=UPI0025A73B02|nr:non-ribosomal peptide synthase/polyketide synthase [Thiotrichales bacterium HSG14]